MSSLYGSTNFRASGLTIHHRSTSLNPVSVKSTNYAGMKMIMCDNIQYICIRILLLYEGSEDLSLVISQWFNVFGIYSLKGRVCVG